MQKGGNKKVEGREKDIPLKHESRQKAASWIRCGAYTHNLLTSDRYSLPRTQRCQAKSTNPFVFFILGYFGGAFAAIRAISLRSSKERARALAGPPTLPPSLPRMTGARQWLFR